MMAGPFDKEDWNQFIPAEKRLHPDWVKSLFERGHPTTYRKSKDELRFIGMPVGGICCGTLYLGGDGRLWNWDIFNQKIEGVLPRRVSWSDLGMDFQTGDNQVRPRDGATYAKPAVQADSQKIAQGFAIRVRSAGRTDLRPLDASGWQEVAFTGQYPIGTVDYSDPAATVAVRLEAFSPFIPHDADDSGLPATVFCISVTNNGTKKADVEVAGWVQNATCFYSARAWEGRRVNRVQAGMPATQVVMSYEAMEPGASQQRPDIVVEDFENGYGRWKVDGTAFGSEPVSRAVVPPYQGDLGGEGGKVANSHASAPGNGVGEKDSRTGRLTSVPFKVERKYLTFFVGGGSRRDVGVRLRIDGKVVRQTRGHDANRMRLETFDVAEFEGREAVVEVFDDAAGAWANIGVDHFVLTDAPRSVGPVGRRNDFGTMAITAIGPAAGIRARGAVAPATLPVSAFGDGDAAAGPEGPSPVGAVSRALSVGAGRTVTCRFVVSWHFPNTTVPVPDARSGNHYARRFADAGAVAAHVVAGLGRLESLTRLWRDTWQDSTLPHWFLERTFVNTSTLATTTSHRLGTGRFWGWEGVGCCEGTCTHVWHYAQAVGRVFPGIERDLRERVDFGAGFDAATGMIRHRAEGTGPAIDGHCGRILGVWREHQMSTDDSFLRRVWPRVKLAVEYVLRHDTDGDGILDGAQENTLDAAWYGQIAWITSLSLAALRAAEEMARELGDDTFAGRCRARFETARGSMETKLFNSEYFFQIADPKRAKSLGTYEACHIDQVHGQSWAWQVGLGRVLDAEKTRSALHALWKYNFTPDVGPFRRKFTAGRPYALAGDGGLVMTSNPKLIPEVYGLTSWQIGYFNECMSGFEHQVASHMIAEGMVLEGLAVTRAIHDRYHAARRNPFNEIECSDHYARAMASYGSFVSACGFESHGPKGYLGFSPRLTPEDFRAPFTAAGGWGTYWQRRAHGVQSHGVEVRHGRVTLQTVAVELPAGVDPGRATVKLGRRSLRAVVAKQAGRILVQLERPAVIEAGARLEVQVRFNA